MADDLLTNFRLMGGTGCEAANRIERLELGLRVVVGSESHNAAIQLAQIALGFQGDG